MQNPAILAQLMQFPEGQIVAFALILLRMIAFVFAMPLFGTPLVPMTVKVALPLILSVLLFPVLIEPTTSSFAISEVVIPLAFREMFVGLFLGFFVRLFFFAVSVGGELIGISSGLASAQIYNPAMGNQASILEQVQVMVASLMFLALNGHHYFLEGLMRSFQVLPVGHLSFNTEATKTLAILAQDVLILGVQLAAPIVVSIFLANLALGIIGRAVPQMNVLMTSMQATILVTFVVLIVCIPVTQASMVGILGRMTNELMAILKVI